MACTDCQKRTQKINRPRKRTVSLKTAFSNALPSILKTHKITIGLCSKDAQAILHITPENEELKTVIFIPEIITISNFAFRDNKPKYLVETLINSGKQWDANLENSGVLIDIENGTMIEELCVPNSPRWYEGNLYFIDSGRGKLCRVELTTWQDDKPSLIDAKVIDVANIPSFGRGLDFVGNLAFIGLSPVRRTKDTEKLPIVTALSDAEQSFMAASKLLEEQKTALPTPWSTEDKAAIASATEKLTIQQKEYKDLVTENNRCGLWVVDILRGEAMAYYQIDNVDGVNDVKILPSHAQISTTTTQRNQRNVYRTP